MEGSGGKHHSRRKNSKYPFLEMKLVSRKVCDNDGNITSSDDRPKFKDEHMSLVTDLLSGRVVNLHLTIPTPDRQPDSRSTTVTRKAKTADPKLRVLLHAWLQDDGLPVAVTMIGKRSVFKAMAMNAINGRNRASDLLACMMWTKNRGLVFVMDWKWEENDEKTDPKSARPLFGRVVQKELTIRKYNSISILSGELKACDKFDAVRVFVSAEDDVYALIDETDVLMEIKTELNPGSRFSETKMLNNLLTCHLAGVKHLIHATSTHQNSSFSPNAKVRMIDAKKRLETGTFRYMFSDAMKHMHYLSNQLVTRLLRVREGDTLPVTLTGDRGFEFGNSMTGTDLLMEKQLYEKIRAK